MKNNQNKEIYLDQYGEYTVPLHEVEFLSDEYMYHPDIDIMTELEEIKQNWEQVKKYYIAEGPDFDFDPIEEEHHGDI